MRRSHQNLSNAHLYHSLLLTCHFHIFPSFLSLVLFPTHTFSPLILHYSSEWYKCKAVTLFPSLWSCHYLVTQTLSSVQSLLSTHKQSFYWKNTGESHVSVFKNKKHHFMDARVLLDSAEVSSDLFMGIFQICKSNLKLFCRLENSKVSFSDFLRKESLVFQGFMLFYSDINHYLFKLPKDAFKIVSKSVC